VPRGNGSATSRVRAWRHVGQSGCGHSVGSSAWQLEQTLRLFIDSFRSANQLGLVIRPGRGVRMRRRSLTVDMILPTAALSRKKNRGQTNLPRRAASSSAPGWDKPKDRTTKRAALQKGLLVLAEVTKSGQLQGPSGCRTSADVRVTISGSNRGQDARDEDKSSESGGKSGERRRGTAYANHRPRSRASLSETQPLP